MECKPKSSFYVELESIINKYCVENGSDTPVYILADYLNNCLGNFELAVKHREKWYGREVGLWNKGTGEVPQLGG